MDDLRVDAVVLGAIGAVLGYLMPFSVVLGTTIGAVTVGGLLVWVELKNPNVHSSAGLGLIMIVGGSTICFFVPMWLAYWVK